MKNNSRLFIFIFFFCLFLSPLNAQEQLLFPDPEVTISMDFQDASLRDILKIFSIQSGLNFIASEAVQDRKITLYLDKVPAKETMNKLFKANNLSYELDEEANIFTVKDWGKPEMETITKVYYLKYRSVPSAKLEREKKDLLSKGGGSSETDILISLRQVLSKDGKITEDTTTNSLLITDIPSRFPDIDRVVASLDIPQSQVMLDVEILDVSKNTVDKLGFDFGNTGILNAVSTSPITLLLAGTHVSGGGATGSKLFIGDVSKRGKDISYPNIPGTVSFGRTFAEVLDFLRTQSDTKYLARPKLLTLNNETAEIAISKDEIVGYNETVSITDQGSVITREYIRATDLKLTPEGTGVTLRVTPQINLDTNEITLVINPKSSITNNSTIGEGQSDAEIRTTKSTVKVRDGETVILGGLIHQEKTVIATKIPLLGDIPFLGMLFRHKNQTKDLERELLVFITPNIVKDTKFIPAKKVILPEREQTVKSIGINRQASVDTYLNRFENR